MIENAIKIAMLDIQKLLVENDYGGEDFKFMARIEPILRTFADDVKMIDRLELIEKLTKELTDERNKPKY